MSVDMRTGLRDDILPAHVFALDERAHFIDRAWPRQCADRKQPLRKVMRAKQFDCFGVDTLVDGQAQPSVVRPKPCDDIDALTRGKSDENLPDIFRRTMMKA
jgi:hypothetical protein